MIGIYFAQKLPTVIVYSVYEGFWAVFRLYHSKRRLCVLCVCMRNELLQLLSGNGLSGGVMGLLQTDVCNLWWEGPTWEPVHAAAHTPYSEVCVKFRATTPAGCVRSYDAWVKRVLLLHISLTMDQLLSAQLTESLLTTTALSHNIAQQSSLIRVIISSFFCWRVYFCLFI